MAPDDRSAHVSSDELARERREAKRAEGGARNVRIGIQDWRRDPATAAAIRATPPRPGRRKRQPS